MIQRFFTITEVTRRVGEVLAPAVGRQFWVRAEIADRRERGGAFYCALIETGGDGKILAKIAATIWPRDLAVMRQQFHNKGLALNLGNGVLVGLRCSLQYSPQFGLSLRGHEADPALALGDLELKKRDMIEQLRREGLVERNQGCRVPLLPLKVGLVASAASAAAHNFLQTLQAARCGVTIYLADALLQGDQTESSVLGALAALARLDVDLVCLIRGGGSQTDLSSLDNSTIARAIAGYGVGVWTGIGHDPDRSVLDHVAHQSFKTPTAVAEAIVSRFVQARRQMDEARNTLRIVWGYRLSRDQERLARLGAGLRHGPQRLVAQAAGNLRHRAQELRLRVQERLATARLGIGCNRERLRTQPQALRRLAAERLAVRTRELHSGVRRYLGHRGDSLSRLRQRLDRERLLWRLGDEREQVTHRQRQVRQRCASVLQSKKERLGAGRSRFTIEQVCRGLVGTQERLTANRALLKASDPQTALQRGYALVYTIGGVLVRSLAQVAVPDAIRIRLADGTLVSEITKKERHNAGD